MTEAKQKSVILPAPNTHTHPKVQSHLFRSTTTKSISFWPAAQIYSWSHKGKRSTISLVIPSDLRDVTWYHQTKLTSPGHTIWTSYIARRSRQKTELLNTDTNMFSTVMKISPSIALCLLKKGLSTFFTDKDRANTAGKLALETRFSSC